MRLPGSIVLITGAARRIGREIAVDLGRRGCRVAIHYRSGESEARETEKVLIDAGGEAAIFQADLNDVRQIESLVEGVLSRFGALNILINNAAVFKPAAIDETTPSIWDEQFATNTRAPFFMAQQAARVMRRSGGGKIINMADVSGEVIWPSYFAYSVSKAALLAVTRGLAKACAPEIQVNAVSPGPVLFPEDYTEQQKRKAIDRTLLKRQGSVQDVVRAVLFLIESDYLTGEVIHVDGGRHVL